MSDAASESNSASLKRTLGFWDGLGVLISIVIGSGIFASPGVALERSGSPGASLVAWILSGILVAIASFCYAELGAMMPSTGGDFDYLKSAYGKPAGFSYAWFLFWISKPGSIAIIATVFGNYIVAVFLGLSHTDNSGSVEAKAAAVGLIVLMTGINCVGVKQAATLVKVFTALKLLLIAALFVSGIVFVGGNQTILEENLSAKNAFTGTQASGMAGAMIACLWAYDGWSNLNFLAEEMIDFERRLPTVIVSAVIVIISCYVLANTAYLAVLSEQDIVDSDAIGIGFGQAVGGNGLGTFFALGVVASAAGSANGSIMTGGRAFYAVGRAGMFPSYFAQLNDSGAPWFALCAQASWAIILILIPGSSFSTLLDYFGPASWVYYAFTGSTVIYYRYKEPNRPRPFKCPWYPLPPVLLVIISLTLLINSLISSPLFTALALIFILLAFPVYYLMQRNGYGGDEEETLGLLVDGTDEKLLNNQHDVSYSAAEDHENA